MKITSNYSGGLRWLMRRADRLHDRGDFEAEARYLTRLLKLHPGLDRLIARRGLSYFRLARFNDAIRDFDYALKMNPIAKNTLYMRARAKEELNNPQGARVDYEQVVNLDPSDDFAAANLELLNDFLNRPPKETRFTQSNSIQKPRLPQAAGWV